jgi:hypothetical protein
LPAPGGGGAGDLPTDEPGGAENATTNSWHWPVSPSRG